MTLRRQDIIVGVVIAAVVSLFLSPFIPTPTSLIGRHHSVTSVVMAVPFALLSIPSARSGVAPGIIATAPVRSQGLLAMNCVRLC